MATRKSGKNCGKRNVLENILARLRRERPDVHDPEAEIAARRVFVAGAPILSARAQVRADAALVIESATVLRGTLKLRAALAAFALDVHGKVALDLGASTGGFTVALLDAGAARVYAVDAGHGQLLGRLRQDARVINLERTNLGELGPELVPGPVDVVTMDLSYLAIARAAAQLGTLHFAPDAALIALVKPMFELALDHAPTDDASLTRAVLQACAGLARHGWHVLASAASPIPGGRGAIEAFVYARRAR